jgi:hypothetical protein
VPCFLIALLKKTLLHKNRQISVSINNNTNTVMVRNNATGQVNQFKVDVAEDRMTLKFEPQVSEFADK